MKKNIILFIALLGVITNTYSRTGAGFSTTGSPSSQAVTFSGTATVTEISPSSGVLAAYSTSVDGPGSGRYILKTSATSTGDPAITINNDNVEIDLGGHNLDGASADEVGIKINAGFSNITIKNGGISNFTKKAIEAEDNNNCNIRIENIHITDCNATGISFLGSDGGENKGIIIKDCTINGNTGENSVTLATEHGTAAKGIHLQYCEGILVEDTIISGMKAAANTYCHGVLLDTCTDVTLVNTASTAHESNEYCYAFTVTSSSGILFDS